MSGFEVVLSVVITVALGLSGWALKSVVSMQADIATHEAEIDSLGERIEDKDKETDRRISDMKDDNTRQYSQLVKLIGQVGDSVTSIHKRIDSFMDRPREKA